MKKIYFASLIGCIALSFTACTKKDSSLGCTYFNRPENVKVAFVNFYDYEIDRVILFQYQKNSNFSDLIRADTYVYAPMPLVSNDTSPLLIDLNNKADYIVSLPNYQVSFKVNGLNYEEEYFSVNEPTGECNTKNYSQKATSAVVNTERVSLDIQSDHTRLYLSK